MHYGMPHRGALAGKSRAGIDGVQAFEQASGGFDIHVRIGEAERIDSHADGRAGHELHESRCARGVDGIGVEARFVVGYGSKPLPVPAQRVGITAEDGIVGADGERGSFAKGYDGVVEDGGAVSYVRGVGGEPSVMPGPDSTHEEGRDAQR